MAFNTKRKLLAMLVVVIGCLCIVATLVPPYLVRNFQFSQGIGVAVAAAVVAVMFLLSFLGKELIALGLNVLQESTK